MKDNKKDNQSKADWDQRQKEKGLIKACHWISPDDSELISNQCRLSRGRHDKRAK